MSRSYNSRKGAREGRRGKEFGMPGIEHVGYSIEPCTAKLLRKRASRRLIPQQILDSVRADGDE